MASINFHRSFVMLKTLDKGYGYTSGKDASGYIKLEIRKSFARLYLYLQDLRVIDKKIEAYDLFLVSNQPACEPLRLAPITPDKEGKFELTMNFNSYNIRDSGYGFEEFKGLAIVHRVKDDPGYIGIPLVGQIDKHIGFDWRGDIRGRFARLYGASISAPVDYNSFDETEKDDGLVDLITDLWDQVEREKASQEQYPQDQAIQADSSSENQAIGQVDQKKVLPDIAGIGQEEAPVDLGNELGMKGERPDPYYTGFLDPASLESSPYEQKASDPAGKEYSTLGLDPEEKDQDPFKGQYQAQQDPYKEKATGLSYWDRVKDYFNDLFNKHRKICPFDNAGDEDWIRIDHIDNWAMHFRGPRYYYRPSVASIDHYLVGLRRQEGRVRYLMYAIPGLYSPIPPMSIHGLSKWLPLKGGYGRGYWILFIDAKTGEIAYPS
ncbi:MAG: hypothetical protein GX461_00660 [Clostridiales bacterium]|nr:hypothetical protein [Clostridiales bacterium]